MSDLRTRCAQRIRDGHLVCIRLDEHSTHVYQASDAPDAVRDEEADE